ncbi:MAG: PDZ domain-containing protein [Nitrospiraceae bacterium]|nr:PDZ domain-containing protein [Nitrospiraceae bacterium]
MSKKRLFSLINILLTSILAITFIFTARDLVTFSVKSGKPYVAEASRPHQPARPAANILEYAPVAKDNAFGFPPMDLKVLTSASKTAAPSSVNLIGTVTGALGYAVVIRDSKEELYRKGQMIPGVGYLNSVGKDYVSIKGTGGNVKLPLKDLSVVKEVSGAPGKAPAPGGNFVRQAGSGSYIVNKNAVSAAIDNPSRILGDARMLPNFVDGKQQGFVIREVKPGGVFNEMGLKNGDVLLKINDFEISGPDAALKAFTALKGLDSVNLDIMRDGQKLTLTYQIR